MISTQYMYGISLKTRNVQFSWKNTRIIYWKMVNKKEIYISKEILQVIISILHHVQILLFVNQYTT